MKIAILSDIHDNKQRLSEAISKCKEENVKTCICCGDISKIEIINKLSEIFKDVFIALGNMDVDLKKQINLFSKNCIVSQDVLEVNIDGLRFAVVHHDYKAKEIAKKGSYDYVFYGHTHTPWEKKYGKTTILNPGEISGQFGKASFAIFETKTGKVSLRLLK